MPTEALVHNTPTTLIQNVVYALPPGKSTLFTDATTPTLQVSNTVGFTANVAVTLTGGMATVGGAFIRSTAGNALVTLTRD